MASLTATLLRFRILGVADIDHLAALAQGVLGRVALQGLAGHDTVYFWQLVRRSGQIKGIEKPTCKDVLEGKLNVAGVKSGSLNEGQVVLACCR